MAPITRVKFLAVDDQRIGARRGIELLAVVCNVGETLFLVDDQRIDQAQIFGLGLRREVSRRIAIDAAIIHMNVHVGTRPMSRVRHRPALRVQVHGKIGDLVRGRRDVAALESALESIENLHAYRSRGYIDFDDTARVEIMRFEFALAAIEAVVGVYPGAGGRVKPAT